MRLTERGLNRATLERQMLRARQEVGVVEAVRAVGALQAQSPASPYLALWNRVAAFDPAELDRAFAEHRLVKASLIRIALHVVTAETYPAFHRAMVHHLRRSCLGDTRFTRAGLSTADADAFVSRLLAFASEPRTTRELQTMIAERAGVPGEPVWWAMRRFVPVVHAPTGGPWAFGDRPSYVAAGVEPFAGSEEEAVALLVRRFLEAFGPASDADFGQFTMIPRPPTRAALEILADDLVRYEGPAGTPLWDVPEAPLPEEEVAAPPRLLGMWDNVLLAYKDRARVIPEHYRKLVLRMNGDTLPVVLVDGYVAGVWRPAPAEERAIEVTAFRPLDEASWEALVAEARSLVAFLAGRDRAVYARYAHWWSKLPSAEVRVMAG